jgi:hypothetical protein
MSDIRCQRRKEDGWKGFIPGVIHGTRKTRCHVSDVAHMSERTRRTLEEINPWGVEGLKEQTVFAFDFLDGIKAAV